MQAEVLIPTLHTMRLIQLTLLLTASTCVAAQSPAAAQPKLVWLMQESGTTAGLRGIDSVDGTVAWASGTGGTILKTIDGGQHWHRCAIPDGDKDGATLDFRGVQAWDATTAIVMASGPGEKSRLYKTTDGCRSWKLIATNPDKAGFWDSLQAENDEHAFVLGDSVAASLRVWEWREGWDERELELSYQMKGACEAGEASFAASNSVLQLAKTPQVDPTWKYALRIASGTTKRSYISFVRDEQTQRCEPCLEQRQRVEVPMSRGTDSAGVFSLGFRSDLIGAAVGGDYRKPNDRSKTAIHTLDGGVSWSVAQTPPHGYRSTVQWSESLKLWITAGTNGSDISRDDGRTWQLLDNGNWNALSLPFVVGPNGRIARLNPAALSPAKPRLFPSPSSLVPSP
jgi:hypothetical protein